MEKKYNKVVLAYSGGLDTSVLIPWLKEHYNDPEIIAVAADVGQGDELDGLEEKAIKTGASKLIIADLTDEMCDEVIVMYAGSICEQGTADEIFYNPRHEYTKGLMRSIPTAENNGQRLEPITGTPIDLLNMPKGCPFAPRCEAAMKICLKEKPVRMLINDDHMATCWMNVKKGVEDGSITEEGGVPCV